MSSVLVSHLGECVGKPNTVTRQPITALLASKNARKPERFTEQALKMKPSVRMGRCPLCLVLTEHGKEGDQALRPEESAIFCDVTLLYITPTAWSWPTSSAVCFKKRTNSAPVGIYKRFSLEDRLFFGK